jgi:uncharacterized protein (DUF4415 family)
MLNVTKIVRFRIDPNNVPEPDPEDLARFDAIRDEDIDYSDIPELGDEFWENAVPFKEMLARLNTPKTSVTIRYDADIIAWFKENAAKDGKKGKGYQTAMNAVLKAYVKAQKG